MDVEDTAKVVLSEYSTRRYHLDRVIVTWDGLALTGTLAILSFAVKWDALLTDSELFAIQLAWAGALSSLLVGLWRLYAHYLYNHIVRLYPTIYLHESAIVPHELCTIHPPKGRDIKPLAMGKARGNVKYITVHHKDFDGGGHGGFDLIAGAVIVVFGVASMWTALSMDVITVSLFTRPHMIGYLLLGNCVGLVLVEGGWGSDFYDSTVCQESREIEV